jgi:predicted methyltransferase
MRRRFLSFLGFSAALAAGAMAQRPLRAQEPPHFVRVTSKESLLHLGSLDSFDVTEGGTRAAELVYEYLVEKRPESAQRALALYERLIPSENFGGEYTALQWLCECLIATKERQAEMLSYRPAEQWFRLLGRDDFAALKEYLKQKYHLLEWRDRRTPKSADQFRFMEDFILFSNPRRDRWEKTGQVMAVLPLREGDVVADIGSGPGYYTFRFADIVGAAGMVYAIDTNARHTEYVAGLAREFGLANVRTIVPPPSGPTVERKADMVFVCSLYHIIYTLDTDAERDRFVQSIRDMLKPEGSLVVIDNAMVKDEGLPYHGPYIERDLVVNQLWYYGFSLVQAHQFIPQRYVLIFRMRPGPEPPPTTPDRPLPADCVPTTSKSSVVRALKTATTPGFTLAGRGAARVFRAALETYQALQPKERFGDEYSAHEWFCEYLLAGPQEQQRMLGHWFVRDYFTDIAADDFAMLKNYLRLKYFLDEVLDEKDAERVGVPVSSVKRRGPNELEVPASSGYTQDQINEWGEKIAFNNPYRERWEKTGQVLEFLKIRQGDHVADLGCGPGYYTFKFAELVGPTGSVSAVDTLQTMLDYIDVRCRRNKVANVKLVLAREDDCRLPEHSVDLVYVCSLYHAVYLGSMGYVRDGFVSNIKRALRQGGRLVIADNAVLRDSENPYYGPTIAPELVIAQLRYYGLRLVDRAQFIPQRYVLVFELAG